MGKYITLGEWNKHYKYLLLLILFNLFIDIVKGANYEGIFKTIGIFEEAKVNFSSHNYIHQIYSFFGIFIFSLILNKFESSASKTNIDKIVSINEDNESNKSNKSNESDKSSDNKKSKELIYLKYEEKTGFDYMNLFYSILITIFILVVSEQFLVLYGIILKDLDFWMLEIVILSKITKKMFNSKIYKHQKLGLILNIFSFVFKICSIITSFIDDSPKTKKIIYVKYNIFFLGFIGFIIYLFSITLRSYSNSKLKWFMDLRYIFSSKILVIYGLMGTIICITISLVSTFIKCKNITDEIQFNDYICYLTNNIYKNDNSTNSTELYFESFKLYFKKFSNIDTKEIFFEIIFIILLMIVYFFDKYFYVLIIKKLSAVHVVFTCPLYFFIQKLMLGIYTLIREKQFFSKKNIYLIYKFHFDIFRNN